MKQIVCRLFATLLLLNSISISAQDKLKNLPELSLPVSNKKLVMAHYMTNIIRYKGHKLEDSCDPEFYPENGNITSSLGGLTQVKVLSDSILKDRTLDEAVEFEMRTALQSGIDGFQFYYVLGTPGWDEIIKAFFRVADRKQLDFKFALCISHPDGSTEALKIAGLSKRMNAIFKEVGKNNPHWLRTPDGRMILYMWYGEQLADLPSDLNGLSPFYYMARAYNRLAEATGEHFACIFSINERIDSNKLNELLDYFPSVWMWTVSFTDDYAGKSVAALCKTRKRSFMGSAFPDFYTSKLLKRGTWQMFHHATDAVCAGINSVERKYIATGLSYNYRKLLEFSIEQDVSIINVITWNDYPEGHHLAPELNHNDGFSLLLKYYKGLWKKEPDNKADEDVVISFFKKYKHNISPVPYKISLVSFQEDAVSYNSEDSIEVVTLLKDKADLTVNQMTTSVPRGMFVSRFKMHSGPVQVTLSRNGVALKHFVTPESITSNPYRTDRLTYSWSTETESWRRSFYKIFSQPDLTNKANIK